MNGSENSYAGALFFALISLGALLKIDDIFIGGVIGAAGAFLSAISFRRALVKSAQAVEEDHQRMEVQFQQLRSKIIETSSANVTAMNSLNDVTKLLQENLQFIREQSTEMNNLINLVKSAESINSAIAGLEENSFALNTELEKIFVAIQTQGNFSDVTDELKKLTAIEDTNRANLQTVLKILHVVAQILKNQSYEKELEKINSSIEQLGNRNEIFNELKNSAADAQKNLSELVKINGTLSRGFTTTLDDLRLDVAKLSAKLEELNSALSKNNSALTEDDINLLKKIAAKINLK